MVSNSLDSSMLLRDMAPFNGSSNHQSLGSAAGSGRFVYARRKSEAESGKNTAFSTKITNTNADQEDETKRIYSSASSRSKGEQNTRQWEERHQRLLSFLSKMDRSECDDYLRVLRTLSSVELSQHAVELEKRSMKLSVEEGEELQRVMMLNVFGKSTKTSSTVHQD